jgi:glycosyltransferase involved in cell wall biosynthesis
MDVSAREPTVSVCIPTYNRRDLLEQAIGSVLQQSFADFELIVSDNASDDGTEALVRSCGDLRIVYAPSARNLGLRGNWQRCLRLARGRFIALFPDDDLMMATNLAQKVDVLTKHPNVGFVHSKYHVIDGDGRVVRYDTNWGHGPERREDALERGQDVLAGMLAGWNIVNTPTVVFRRDCRDRLGGFTDRLDLAFDWEYWMRLSVHFDVAFLAAPLVKWRKHAKSQTSQHVHAKDEPLTVRALREGLAAKRLVLRAHRRAIDNYDGWRRRLRREMLRRIVARAVPLLAHDGPNPAARRLLVEMCCAFPELLREVVIWRLLLKSVLSRRGVETLKRVSPIR